LGKKRLIRQKKGGNCRPKKRREKSAGPPSKRKLFSEPAKKGTKVALKKERTKGLFPKKNGENKSLSPFSTGDQNLYGTRGEEGKRLINRREGKKKGGTPP